MERRKEMRFFPNFFLREMIGWYVALALLDRINCLLPMGTWYQG